MPADGGNDPDQATLDRLARELEVDVRAGLAVVQGRADRYLALLSRLADSHREDMRQLAASLERNERENAIRIAHSLKGAAATLGVRRLSDAAREVEMALRETGAIPPGALEKVERALAALGARLPSTPAAPPSSAPAADALLDALVARLAAGDFAAAELYETNAAAIAAALGAEAPAVARAIARYDFRAALERIAAARAAS